MMLNASREPGRAKRAITLEWQRGGESARSVNIGISLDGIDAKFVPGKVSLAENLREVFDKEGSDLLERGQYRCKWFSRAYPQGLVVSHSRVRSQRLTVSRFVYLLPVPRLIHQHR